MNRKRWMRIFSMYLGIATLMFFVSYGTAKAATLCVEKSGANGCYTSIQAAVDVANSGDTIEVHPESYSEVNIHKNVVIIGIAGPERTTIMALSGNAGNVGSNSTVTIRGFRISGGTNGVYVANATLTLRNNEIIGTAGHGVYCYSAYTLSTTCNVINNTIDGSGGEGIQTANPADAQNRRGTSNIFISSNMILDSINISAPSSASCFYNTITGVVLGTSCSSTQTADPLFIPGNYCAVQSASPSIDAGSPSPTDNDPDGTRNNQGACGGPYAAAFWPYPSGGPVITNLTVTPASVPQGGTVT